MKALIISDKQDTIKLLQKRLEKEGFDTIVYKWLIKALDNVEEIRPDFIILSVQEYPRHWKTLASFVQSGIGGNDVRFCLYNDELLSAEDKTKAEQLGVEFYSELREINLEEPSETPEVEAESIPENPVEAECEVEAEDSVPTVETIFTENKQDINDIPETYSVIITNPVTGKFIYGTSLQKSYDTFECLINVEDLSVDQIIKYVTVCNKNNSISFSGEIKSIEIDSDAEKVNIKVLNYYEK